jgi:hypothetical protein
MRVQTPECPKCHRSMRAGYLLDLRHHDRRGQARWVEGPPEKSFWKGLETSRRRVLPVTTWRCERCGLLESYAQAET